MTTGQQLVGVAVVVYLTAGAAVAIVTTGKPRRALDLWTSIALATLRLGLAIGVAIVLV